MSDTMIIGYLNESTRVVVDHAANKVWVTTNYGRYTAEQYLLALGMVGDLDTRNRLNRILYIARVHSEIA